MPQSCIVFCPSLTVADIIGDIRKATRSTPDDVVWYLYGQGLCYYRTNPIAWDSARSNSFRLLACHACSSYAVEARANMMQITVFALYGEKSSDFAALITRCQELGRGVLGVGFRPYDPSQIHATIFGLERKIGSAFYNANFSR